MQKHPRELLKDRWIAPKYVQSILVDTMIGSLCLDGYTSSSLYLDGHKDQVSVSGWKHRYNLCV